MSVRSVVNPAPGGKRCSKCGQERLFADWPRKASGKLKMTCCPRGYTPPQQFVSIQEQRREWKRRRRASGKVTTRERLHNRMATAVGAALRGMKKGRRWECLLGYSLDDLVAHLRQTMPEGMTLEEAVRQGWQIDHRWPRCDFDPTNEAELRACWSLSNLQMLSAEANARKGSTRPADGHRPVL